MPSNDERAIFTLRLPTELDNTIARLAKQEKKSKNKLCSLVLERWVREQQELLLKDGQISPVLET